MRPLLIGAGAFFLGLYFCSLLPMVWTWEKELIAGASCAVIAAFWVGAVELYFKTIDHLGFKASSLFIRFREKIWMTVGLGVFHLLFFLCLISYAKNSFNVDALWQWLHLNPLWALLFSGGVVVFGMMMMYLVRLIIIFVYIYIA